jgi:Domain of unknown function (DUF1833)
MSQSMTPTFWNEVSRSAKEEQMLLLITFTHPSLLEPIRVVNDTVDHSIGGLVYFGWPLEFQFPSASQAGAKGTITIQNVDRRIGDTIRDLKGKISFSFSIIYKSEPDIIITSQDGYTLANVEVKATQVRGEIIGRGSIAVAWPSGRATPARTPGLHL